MRIPSGVTDQVIYFVAVDSTDLKTRETGLTTFTVYRSRNGGAAAAMTTPTVTQVDATNMPGVYKLLLNEDMTIDAGDDSQEMVFHITQAAMAPVTRTIELYRPKFTAGSTLAVSDITAGVLGGVVDSQGSVTLKSALQGAFSVLCGETTVSGGTYTILSPDGIATRVTFTLDANKQRTGVTLNLVG